MKSDLKKSLMFARRFTHSFQQPFLRIAPLGRQEATAEGQRHGPAPQAHSLACFVFFFF